MDPKLAQTTLRFLERVQLRGDEVDAFLLCRQALQQETVDGEPGGRGDDRRGSDHTDG